MLVQGVLNPDLLHLLARFRHTNALVIADRGFPFWPGVPTLDLSVIDGLPTVLQILDAIRPNLVVGEAVLAKEFKTRNGKDVQERFARSLEGVPVTWESHLALKKRVPGAIGLIRTGDVLHYTNMVLISA